MSAVFVLQRGSGVDVNHQLSLELFRRAAELGDPQAQGMMGMRMAMGLHHYGSFEGASIRQFGPVRGRQDSGDTLPVGEPKASHKPRLQRSSAVKQWAA